MNENILVAKQKGNKFKLKVTKRKRNQYSPPQYSKVLNPNDSNDLALLFGDLKIYFNSPIEKAFKIFSKDAEELGDAFFLWEKK